MNRIMTPRQQQKPLRPHDRSKANWQQKREREIEEKNQKGKKKATGNLTEDKRSIEPVMTWK